MVATPVGRIDFDSGGRDGHANEGGDDATSVSFDTPSPREPPRRGLRYLQPAARLAALAWAQRTLLPSPLAAQRLYRACVRYVVHVRCAARRVEASVYVTPPALRGATRLRSDERSAHRWRRVAKASRSHLHATATSSLLRALRARCASRHAFRSWLYTHLLRADMRGVLQRWRSASSKSVSMSQDRRDEFSTRTQGLKDSRTQVSNFDSNPIAYTPEFELLARGRDPGPLARPPHGLGGGGRPWPVRAPQTSHLATCNTSCRPQPPRVHPARLAGCGRAIQPLPRARHGQHKSCLPMAHTSCI